MCIENCGTRSACDISSRIRLADKPNGRWVRNGRRLMMASAVMGSSLGLMSALPAAATDDIVDIDGSMFGTAPEENECVDTDGDGYGWDGSETCFPNGVDPADQKPAQNDQSGETFQPQRDNEPDQTTQPGDNDQPDRSTPDSADEAAPVDSPPSAECTDTDGDGYGWDGSKTCFPNGVNPNPVTPKPTKPGANNGDACVNVYNMGDPIWGSNTDGFCVIGHPEIENNEGINSLLWIDGEPTCRPHFTKNITGCDFELMMHNGTAFPTQLDPEPTNKQPLNDFWSLLGPKDS